MGRNCSQCGTGILKRTEHHFEALNVCENCGASEAPAVQFSHHSPVKQINGLVLTLALLVINKFRI